MYLMNFLSSTLAAVAIERAGMAENLRDRGSSRQSSASLKQASSSFNQPFQSHESAELRHAGPVQIIDQACANSESREEIERDQAQKI